MAKKNKVCEKLLRTMIKKEYPEPFCELIVSELNTDYTAGRMLAYFSRYPAPSLEEIADEMLAIQSDRDAWIQKKMVEENQAKWNMQMMRGFDSE